MVELVHRRAGGVRVGVHQTGNDGFSLEVELPGGRAGQLSDIGAGADLDRVESVAVDELSVTLRSGLTAGDWQAKGDRLLATLAGLDKPVVLFVDEVPILVSRLLKGADYKTTPERRQQTDAFLSWLRYNAIRHQNRLTFVLAGSVGLEPIVRQAGLSGTLNAFTAFELRPWEPDVAAACLQALASETGLRLETAAIEHMLDRLGACIPGHVQMFFDHPYRACR